MSPLKLIVAVTLAFGLIALLMLAVPLLRKRQYKRQRQWNNTRPKHDLSRSRTDEQSGD